MDDSGRSEGVSSNQDVSSDLAPSHPAEPGGLNRRRFLRLAGGAGAAAGLSYLVARGVLFSDETGEATSVLPDDPSLRLLAENVTSGGVPKDGIPAIDEPRFLSAAEADFLDDDDVVFGMVRDGEARAYPQMVLVWHEIVNDRFPSGRVSVTYCPLTGSVVGFAGRSRSRAQTFGTSGDLVNSNLLMYDRQTDSRWPQILGRAITGPLAGQRLSEVPLEWTTWRRWRSVRPETTVLSTDTGFARDYGRDPYGSYTPLSGYYVSQELFFPLVHHSDRFKRKEVFIGAKRGDAHLAVRKDHLRSRRVVPAEMEGDGIVFLFDSDLDAGRAFISRAKGMDMRFKPADDDGLYEDIATGSIWDAAGSAVAGPLQGASVPRVLSYDVMWFAWYAFFPKTAVIA